MSSFTVVSTSINLDTKVASAKKVCECGHVFLEKKRRGFQEKPIVITNDRLRSSPRVLDAESRPVRVKKHKYHGTDFVYSGSKAGNSSSSQEVVPTATELDANKQGQHSKRERIKTQKYESFFSKRTSKKIMIQNSSQSKVPLLTADSSVVETHSTLPKHPIIEDTIALHNDILEEKHDIDNSKPVYSLTGETDAVHRDYEAKDSSVKAMIGNIDITNNDCSEIKNENENRDKEKEDEYDSEIYDENDEDTDVRPKFSTKTVDRGNAMNDLLLGDFDTLIDVLTDDHGDSPLLSTLPAIDETSFSESESIVEDDVRLKQIKIPHHVRKRLVVKRKRLSHEVDDIPLSKLMRSGGHYGRPMQIRKDGKLKRPVGRPRKNPYVIKVKRPVGRPRKERMDSVQNQNGFDRVAKPNNEERNNKVRRGRPPAVANDFPSYGMYAEHLFYDGEDEGDDEADPDYKSPTRTNRSHSMNRSNRTARASMFSPSQIMERMRADFGEIEAERWKKNFSKRQSLEIPPEKKELYSHILKEINRRIISQTFTCAL